MKPTHQRLEIVVLSRLLAHKKGANQLDLLVQTIEGFSRRGNDKSTLRQQLDQVLANLQENGQIAGEPPKLTKKGRKRVTSALGLEPDADPPKWASLLSQSLIAFVLNIPVDDKNARKRIKTADGLRAAILRHEHKLTNQASTTLTSTLDALVCHELGVKVDGPLTLQKIRGSILSRLLGSPDVLPPIKAARLLAAKALNGDRTDVESIRQRVIAAWLVNDDVNENTDDSPAKPLPANTRDTAEISSSLSEREPSGRPLSLQTFARTVCEIAKSVSEGRYGDDRVFVAAIWRVFKDGDAAQSMTIEAFKSRLIEANRAGYLRLRRADLVAAMNAEDVRASEISYLNATFHFVELQSKEVAA